VFISFFLSEFIDEIELILALPDLFISMRVLYRCMPDVCHSTRNGLISLPGVHTGESLIDMIISKAVKGSTVCKKV
jgi:hypothetical protein